MNSDSTPIKKRVDWFKYILLFLVIVLIAAIFLVLVYARSDGFKCLADPNGWAINHTIFRTAYGNYKLPTTTINLSK